MQVFGALQLRHSRGPACQCDEALLHECIGEAVGSLLASVLVTTGPNTVAALGALPANAHAEPYLAQSLMLPHVDQVVSHGGAGGTVGARRRFAMRSRRRRAW